MKQHTVVVGAGWAGISCALELTKLGHKVTLLEAAPYPGGRAREVNSNGFNVDNGQHIMIGAYKKVRQILAWIGIDENKVFYKSNFKLITVDVERDLKIKIEINKYFYPLNVLFAILCASNYRFKDKLNLLSAFYKIKKNKFLLSDDITVMEFLNDCKQSKFNIENFWEPLVTASLTTPIQQASTQVFLNVLKDTFCNVSSSQLLIPKVTLSELFVNPAVKKLKNMGQNVFMNTRVASIECIGSKEIVVKTNKQEFVSNSVVVATNYYESMQIIATLSFYHKVLNNLSKLVSNTIVTVYLRYDDNINLSFPMLAITGACAQWVFDKHISGDSNTLAVIATYMPEYDNQTLSYLVNKELQQILTLPNLTSYKVIKEKKAAFSCEPSSHSLRPETNILGNNIYLAGDYTRTPYPATLEGACLSGIEVAKLINKN